MERRCFSFQHALILLLIVCESSGAVCRRSFNHSAPALFVFGDSTVDPGNNNFWPTPFKGNFPPYGASFPNHVPTGRFSDGKLATDFIASYLGIKELVPPYLSPTLDEREMMTGVSFAFAGSGYDPMTAHTSRVVSVPQQLDYMKDCLTKMERRVGKARAAKIVEDSIFIVSAATNDFVISYYLLPFRKQTFTLDEYQQFILDQLRVFLKGLYELGARRIMFAGLPPLGCLPVVMTISISDALIRQCIDSLNMEAVSYNSKLQNMLNEIKEKELKDAKIGYADIYYPVLDAIENPSKYSFEETNRGCCGTGLLELSFLCNPVTPTCPDVTSYVFWDAIHPTQKTYSIVSNVVIQQILHLLLQ